MPAASRVWLCRAMFVALCAVPTAASLVWIAAPGSSASSTAPLGLSPEERVSSWLGLKITAGRIAPQGSGSLLLEDVAIADPEGGLLATAEAVEFRDGPNGIEIGASGVEAQSAGLPRLAAVLHDRCLRDGRGLPPVRFQITRLTIVETAPQSDVPLRRVTFLDVSGSLEAEGDARRLAADFRRAGFSSGDKGQFRLERQPASGDSRTRWRLDSGRAMLPIWMLTGAFPSLAQLGDAAEFTGRASAGIAGESWETEIAGEVQRLDLYRLITEQFPHGLSGQARVRIERARLSGGRLVEAAGDVECEGGVVSRSLLAALNEAGLTLVKETGKNWRFARMAFAFSIDERGIALTGKCDGGEILTDLSGPLLLPPADESPLPVLSLVRALVPDSQLLVPATRQTEPLLAALPIPRIVPAAESAGSPSATLRLDDDEPR